MEYIKHGLLGDMNMTVRTSLNVHVKSASLIISWVEQLIRAQIKSLEDISKERFMATGNEVKMIVGEEIIVKSTMLYRNECPIIKIDPWGNVTVNYIPAYFTSIK